MNKCRSAIRNFTGAIEQKLRIMADKMLPSITLKRYPASTKLFGGFCSFYFTVIAEIYLKNVHNETT